MPDVNQPNPLPQPVLDFLKNSPHASAINEENLVTVNKPWGTEDSQFSFEVQDSPSINELSNLLIDPQLDALMHLDTNEAEFIFAFLAQGEEPSMGYSDRKFTFHFETVKYECEFRKPSPRLMTLARNYRRLPSDGAHSAARQLVAFRDFQQQDKLSLQGQRYFENRIPRSFFIKPSITLKEIDWESLSSHLNLLMSYYDRNSPSIVFRPKLGGAKEKSVEALRYVEGSFPKELAFRTTDEILIRLLEVARKSAARFAFIYCFQVFEYAGFHFIDAKTKGSLIRLLRSPSFIACADEKMSELFSLLTEAAQNDDVRIRKVIEEYCNPKTLWKEIEQNKDFFSNDVVFEGGVIFPKLVTKDTTEDIWCTMWMPKLIDQITRVRNCLVHAREKRENRVILPTLGNDAKISMLLPMILRMAEQIVIHGDKN